jgi:hypothetical protein
MRMQVRVVSGSGGGGGVVVNRALPVTVTGDGGSMRCAARRRGDTEGKMGN